MESNKSVEIFYSKQTLNAVENFGKEPMNRDFIKAFAEVKKACISAVYEYSENIDEKIQNAVITAIDSIIQGDYDNQFIVPIRQGSAGTSINMNFNEVIAGLSNRIYKNTYNDSVLIDPIEDINRFQSTNDVFPTAVTIMVYRHLLEIEEAVIRLQELLASKENEYSGVLITGRTEMQTALPITLGQVFGAWAGCIERDRWRINKLKERVRTIALGGTAIGTCFSAPKQYVFFAEKNIRAITGLPLSRSQNLPDEISNTDKLSETASGYRLLAENLFKITGDLLIYTSSFVNEINQPVLQYGSTIMPAKTNPVILEFARGLSMDIQGEAYKVSLYSQNGQLQLNAYLPFITGCFINMHKNIIKLINTLIDRFLNKITLNNDNIEHHLAKSNVFLNTLLPALGYNAIKDIYSHMDSAKPMNLSDFKKIIKEKTGLTDEQLDDYFDPVNSTSFLK